MQPVNTNTDYKTLITELIKKQIVVLGPYITLAKARNVKGLAIDDNGTVTQISGNPQEIIQNLIDQFVQLSGLIVKKTMEPLLAGYPEKVDIPNPMQAPASPSPQTNIPVQDAPQQTMQTETTKIDQTTQGSTA